MFLLAVHMVAGKNMFDVFPFFCATGGNNDNDDDYREVLTNNKLEKMVPLN